MRSRKDPFRGRRVTAEFMLWTQRGYLQFSVNYRNGESMLVDRGVEVDHTTVYRWIQDDAPELDKRLGQHLRGQ